MQVGRLERLIYLEMDGEEYRLINPELVSLSEAKFEMWDDCFSFPGLMVRLRRSESCRVRYQVADGACREIEASGPFSELLQHEIDHLDGILAVDRAMDRDSFMTRAEWLRQQGDR